VGDPRVHASRQARLSLRVQPRSADVVGRVWWRMLLWQARMGLFKVLIRRL